MHYISQLKEKIKYVYEHHYKKILFFPMLLVILSLVQIGAQYATTGEFVHKGISLKGGSLITLTAQTSLSPAELEQFLKQKFSQGDFSVRALRAPAGETLGLSIESDAQQKSEIDDLLSAVKEKIPLQKGEYSVEVIDSSLGNSFFRQTFIALLVAFLLMGVVVFVYFRVPIPSLAVILAAFSDMTVTLAVFNLTGMKLSSAGVAAFLMLIGYSVDTDILLTTRVLKRHEGTVMERVYGSITTGLTMLATTFAAVMIALIFVQSEVIRQIMVILCIGLIVDAFMTWIQNVGVLRLYLERKQRQGEQQRQGGSL